MIKLEHVTVAFKDHVVLDGLSMAFEPHQITALYGPSGCGKTTLLNAIASLVPYQGHISLPGKIAYVFQEDRLMPWLTVYENIAFVLKDIIDEDHLGPLITHYLELVGLLAMKDKYPKALSGGMKRRVSLARAFAYPSEVLLMDEPFNGLDDELKAQIMTDFMTLWQEDPRTVLWVTHDESDVMRMSHQMVYLKGCPLGIERIRRIK